jgi:hypothetical protein
MLSATQSTGLFKPSAEESVNETGAVELHPLRGPSPPVHVLVPEAGARVCDSLRQYREMPAVLPVIETSVTTARAYPAAAVDSLRTREGATALINAVSQTEVI